MHYTCRHCFLSVPADGTSQTVPRSTCTWRLSTVPSWGIAPLLSFSSKTRFPPASPQRTDPSSTSPQKSLTTRQRVWDGPRWRVGLPAIPPKSRSSRSRHVARGSMPSCSSARVVQRKPPRRSPSSIASKSRTKSRSRRWTRSHRSTSTTFSVRPIRLARSTSSRASRAPRLSPPCCPTCAGSTYAPTWGQNAPARVS